MINITIQADSLGQLTKQLEAVLADLSGKEDAPAAPPAKAAVPAEAIKPAKTPAPMAASAPKEAPEAQESCAPAESEKAEEPAVSTIDLKKALNLMKSKLNAKDPGSGQKMLKSMFAAYGAATFSELPTSCYDDLMHSAEEIIAAVEGDC